MNRSEFDKLDFTGQVSYINEELIKGSTLTKICKSINIGRTTIRDRFIKGGYSFNKEKNQYLKTTNDKNNSKVTHKNNIVSNDNSKTIVEFNSIKNDLLELIKNKDDILKIIDDYKKNINNRIIDVPELNINDIPPEMQKNINTRSLKIYDPIYKLFSKLCNKYSSIKKQDLISLALLEFYNKYKK
ncbi:DNA-binding protein [Clostridium felsineum]|uniref:DNA-binding protein n=1 Tax=Clostridium felsineum TaxID=36839 RepID=UPI00214D4A85|nr:DNA-binding protein [Clostridium felsineum]